MRQYSKDIYVTQSEVEGVHIVSSPDPVSRYSVSIGVGISVTVSCVHDKPCTGWWIFKKKKKKKKKSNNNDSKLIPYLEVLIVTDKALF